MYPSLRLRMLRRRLKPLFYIYLTTFPLTYLKYTFPLFLIDFSTKDYLNLFYCSRLQTLFISTRRKKNTRIIQLWVVPLKVFLNNFPPDIVEEDGWLCRSLDEFLKSLKNDEKVKFLKMFERLIWLELSNWVFPLKWRNFEEDINMFKD